MISFQENSRLDIKKIFADDGLIARSYEGFEHRPEQVEMADAVQKALTENYHLAVEAGTGVGKSFAYLAAAIDRVLQKKQRALVSTYTITLQEQLINKDIPFLAGVLDNEFRACVATGRGNYICLRRLQYAIRRQQGLFDSSSRELMNLDNWAKNTSDGSLSDLPRLPSSAVWDAVKSEHGNCRARKCPYFKNCFYRRARRELETADIIVANHELV